MLPLIRNRSKLYDVAALYREPVRLEVKERTVFFRERICNVELHLVIRNVLRNNQSTRRDFTQFEAEAPPSRSAGIPMLNRNHKRVRWGGSRHFPVQTTVQSQS